KHDSGIDVLCAGITNRPIGETFRRRAAGWPAFSSIVQAAVGAYDFVVIDAGSAMDDATLTVLDTAARLLLVVNPDAVSVRNVRFAAEWLETGGHSSETIHLVVNKYHPSRIALEKI